MITNKHFLALTIAASLIPDFVSAEEKLLLTQSALTPKLKVGYHNKPT
ncbi:hypothetical protein ACU42Y_06830 [Proteus mirabilis]